MKTSKKNIACIVCMSFAFAGFAKQTGTAQSSQKQTTKKQSTKSAKKTDNKIAVSDQAQPDDKNTKKAAKKDKGVTNK